MSFEEMWRDLAPVGRSASSGGYFRQPWTSVEEELRRAQEEIRALAPMRQYAVEAARAAPPLRAGTRCVVMEQAYAGGQRADSHLCVGEARGWTVKLRLSVPAGDAGARQVLEALGRAATGVLERR